ncbi:unnamed protein product [Medioppia subpectinata]|uniref:Uncharacterized protein n=1 Tax=Medioppia subpectinata TaxID=1979941 RepID=A0A7R9Q3Y3_9ACAR|nr:unnamed protein product [Medioppia subpectinata]CAG2110970.1 unnamed protein product [Medioppia subpectinata]
MLIPMDNSNKPQETNSNTIVFDISKSTNFSLNDGYRTLQRRLKTSGWKVSSNKEEITSEILSQSTVFLILAPKAKYTDIEFKHLRKHIQNGGKLFVMLGEGGERKAGTNVNFLLEEYGISINNDTVVRSAYYKYYHPKEAQIGNGILNRGLLQSANKLQKLNNGENDDTNQIQNISFVYPFGATLNVAKPAVAVLSTGSVSLPLNRPVCAFYNEPKSGGKIVVLATTLMFSDAYIEKEDNSLVKDIIMHYFTDANFSLNTIDAQNPEVSDYYTIPDIELLSEQPFSSLEESEELPSDYNKLFSKTINQITNSELTQVLKAYEELQMDRETLKLIKPQFDTPLPALQPAVFPPTFRELSKPALELFDLDDAFSSIPTRLTQIANKCSENDLEYFVRECGLIVGINEAVTGTKSAKAILNYMFSKIVEFKKPSYKTNLEESEELPSDYNKLFSKTINQITNSELTQVLKAYEELQMDRETLKLIKPQFDTPLPALQPAVFPPTFRELSKPALELFDLDDAFSSIPTRLTQIANKCSENDLEYFVRECGLIVGINEAVTGTKSAKAILNYMFSKIVEFKKVNNDHNLH